MLMSLPDLCATYQMDIRGVLHVGAHLAEEATIYGSLGIADVWWVEANPGVQEILKATLTPYGHRLIHALVYERDGEMLPFNITNYQGMSSSILLFGSHPTFSPDTVFVDRIEMETSTIDTLVEKHGVIANFINLDIQGAEGFALRGATKFLAGVDYVMSEVNKAEVYVGCARVEELDDILSDFRRVETFWVAEQGWGDALWVRR